MGKTGVVHIFASHNNTIILLTDITGSETIAKCSGGIVVQAQHKEGTPYAAMKVAEGVAGKGRGKVFLGQPCRLPEVEARDHLRADAAGGDGRRAA